MHHLNHLSRLSKLLNHDNLIKAMMRFNGKVCFVYAFHSQLNSKIYIHTLVRVIQFSWLIATANFDSVLCFFFFFIWLSRHAQSIINHRIHDEKKFLFRRKFILLRNFITKLNCLWFRLAIDLFEQIFGLFMCSHNLSSRCKINKTFDEPKDGCCI